MMQYIGSPIRMHLVSEYRGFVKNTNYDKNLLYKRNSQRQRYLLVYIQAKALGNFPGAFLTV